MDSRLARHVMDAIHSGNWRLAAAGVLVVVIWAVRAFGSKYFPKLATDRGGAALAVLGGLAGALSNAILGGVPITLNIMLDGLGMGVTAAGGWNVTRRLLWPPDKAEGAPEAKK